MADIGAMVDELVEAGCRPGVAAKVVHEAFLAGKDAARQESSPYRLATSSNYDDGPVFVYHLIDPRYGKPFYVGISQNPSYRFKQHSRDPLSAAHKMLLDLFDDGFGEIEILKIVKECDDRQAALIVEAQMISSFPNLVNRARPQ